MLHALVRGMASGAVQPSLYQLVQGVLGQAIQGSSDTSSENPFAFPYDEVLLSGNGGDEGVVQVVGKGNP